jgi:hypothetical protein
VAWGVQQINPRISAGSGLEWTFAGPTVADSRGIGTQVLLIPHKRESPATSTVGRLRDLIGLAIHVAAMTVEHAMGSSETR